MDDVLVDDKGGPSINRIMTDSRIVPFRLQMNQG
jgi:hypothetical protein